MRSGSGWSVVGTCHFTGVTATCKSCIQSLFVVVAVVVVVVVVFVFVD